MTSAAQVTSALEALSRWDDEPLSTLAEALIPAASERSAPLDSRGFDKGREVVASLTVGYVSAGRPPSCIVDALIRIDTYLHEQCEIAPLAARLAPLAMDCALLAGQDRLRETTAAGVARHLPLLMRKNELFAVLLESMEPEGNTLYMDRILSAVLSHRPRRVVLVLRDDHSAEPFMEALDALCVDLREQGIAVERVKGV